MSNKEKYQDIFQKIFDVDKEKLGDAFNFADVKEWDSMVHLTLITELEDGFEVLFDPDDILHFGGYNNGMKILERYGVDFSE